jgi:hypothetical protein
MTARLHLLSTASALVAWRALDLALLRPAFLADRQRQLAVQEPRLIPHRQRRRARVARRCACAPRRSTRGASPDQRLDRALGAEDRACAPPLGVPASKSI